MAEFSLALIFKMWTPWLFIHKNYLLNSYFIHNFCFLLFIYMKNSLISDFIHILLFTLFIATNFISKFAAFLTSLKKRKYWIEIFTLECYLSMNMIGQFSDFETLLCNFKWCCRKTWDCIIGYLEEGKFYLMKNLKCKKQNIHINI